MTRIITDEFSARTDLSKAQKYQLRKERDGKCRLCGAHAVPLQTDPKRSSHYCKRHYALLKTYRARPARDAREDV